MLRPRTDHCAVLAATSTRSDQRFHSADKQSPRISQAQAIEYIRARHLSLLRLSFFPASLYSNRGVVTGDRSSDMSFWVSRIKRRITIHLASCHTCNEGCGGWIRARRDSATTRLVQTWWGPYENFSAAYRAAKRQVTTTNRAVVRACRHCKPNPASAYMVNAANSPKYLARSSHTDISFGSRWGLSASMSEFMSALVE